MKNERVLVLANGLVHGWPERLAPGSEADYIICADGGLALAQSFGLTPDLVVGDMDSADPAELDRLAGQGVAIARHPRDKDETDLELALIAALARQPREIVVLGAFGKRLDMTLANVLLLASARLFPTPPEQGGPLVRLMDERASVFFLRGPARAALPARVGDTVSLLPLEGPVRGLTLTGMRYPLEEASLGLGSTRGISNVVESPGAEISLRQGGLAVVCSGPED